MKIKNLIEINFGENTKIIQKDDIILLNHVGSEDQMEEIILYGKEPLIFGRIGKVAIH